MTGCGVGSRPATAARAATVLPAPTSPVMTPSRIWSMQKLIRAVAWAWAWRANRSLAAIAFPNGVRASPKCAAHGARLAIAVLLVLHAGELGEVDRRAGAGLLVMGSGDHAEVVDPGRVRLRRRSRGNSLMHVMADHERDRGPGRPAVQEHVDHRQVLRVIAQLNAPAGEGRMEGIGVAGRRAVRARGPRAGPPPPDPLPHQRRVPLPVRPAGLEPVNGRLA